MPSPRRTPGSATPRSTSCASSSSRTAAVLQASRRAGSSGSCAPTATAPSRADVGAVGTGGGVGLGNMGSALAANLVGAGFTVVGHDAAGPERAPEGVTHVESVGHVARVVDVVVCSLPDGAASEAVVNEVLSTSDRVTTHVVDTSTVGVAA